MHTFLEHSAIELTEALNNPQEYYMTDDTKMPTSIYAAFDVNGNKYIMCLEETSDKGVFILEVGRTGDSGGKTYWWKFHKQSDILPVLATTMHFLQAATAWMGPKLKGIAVQFKQGASDQMQRATRIAERIIKRSYVKTFKLVPVAQPAVTEKDKYYHQKIRFLFIAKKNIPLNSLFGGSTFKKYSFDGKEVPAEAIAELEPKKVKKMSNTVKPSKKYSFGQFDVDTPLDDELLDKVGKVAPVDTDASSLKAEIEDAYKKEQEYNNALEAATIGSANAKAGMIQAMPAFKSMVNALKKYGFDENKLNWNDLSYVISNASKGEKELLAAAEMVDVNSETVKNRWKAAMEKIGSPSPSQAIQYITKEKEEEAKKYLSKYPMGKPADNPQPYAGDTKNKVMKSNIDPNQLVASMPGSGIDIKFNGFQFEEADGNWEIRKAHLRDNLGYHKEVGNLKSLSNIVSYSGSQYDKYNQPLRETIKKLFEGQSLTAAEIKEITTNYSKYQKLFKAFDDIKPLPESVWVYRGTHIPGNVKNAIVPGYEFVDPAFLSTSMKPNTNFGYDRMRIFLPKGSKVVPILGHSKHVFEQEILLPPSSVIKVVEVEVGSSGTRYAIQGVFTGSVFKSITEMLKKQLTMAEDYGSIRSLKELIMEQENNQSNKKYNPEGKFGGQYDAELAELISDAIAKGKVKVDPPKTEK
jgi:hypothetical protein